MSLRNRYHDNYSQILQNLPSERKEEVVGLARAIAMGREDPVYFAEFFLGIKLTAKQKIWLWLTTKTKIEWAYELSLAINYELPPLALLKVHEFLKNVLAPGNRFGKTMITAVKHIWYCFYKIGLNGNPKTISNARYPTLNLSPHSLQLDALYRYIVDILESKFVYEWDGENIRNECKVGAFLLDHKQVKREIHFANNSMIKGAPTGDDQASSLAGAMFYLITYDEAPQSIHLREELPAKILSRLIDTGGPCDIIGTPEIDKPSFQYYFRLVKQGLKLEDGFFALQGSSDDNTFINTEKRRKTMESIRTTDPTKYRQVRFGDFISAGSKLFSPDAISRLWDGKEPLPAMTGHRYLISLDWGFADEGDPAVMYIFDYSELVYTQDEFRKFYGLRRPIARVVFRDSVQGGSPYERIAFVKQKQEEYNNAIGVHDSTALGGIMMKKMLKESNIRNFYDFSSNEDRKEEMLFFAARAMTDGRQTEVIDGKLVDKVDDFGRVRSFLIPDLEEQLSTYKMNDKKIKQDEVIAFTQGVWYIEKKLTKNPVKVFDLNILATAPERMLKPVGIRQPIVTRNITIPTRHI